jgi:hypothetical protein
MFKLVVTTVRGRVHYSSSYTIESTGGVAIDTKEKVREIVERMVQLAPTHGVTMEGSDGKLISFPAAAVESCTYVEVS